MSSAVKRRVLLVVMDGVGVRQSRFGNAVALAATPNLDFLKTHGLYTTLFAHGTYVGLPSDADIGNSEVGHNALGAGRIFDQGAKLVQKAVADGSMFQGRTWQDMLAYVKTHNGTLHFLGLLSDGNVHSHEEHLHIMLAKAKAQGIKRVRVHALFDGRDVGEKTAEVYAERLLRIMAELRSDDFDIEVASGGGRMIVTMDRYEADWRIVERGWRAHVLGHAELTFPDVTAALRAFRQDPKLTDQYFPPFVITKAGAPIGTIEDGDGVVFFNFRGDRAIEICRAFADTDFPYFQRQRQPRVFFAGMMEYDGDLHIPENFLVAPPVIKGTLGEYLVSKGVRQFACSETQKYGHVTYFWNGNRSGKLDSDLEEYVEITSDLVPFDQKPEMKAAEITEVTTRAMTAGSFDFGRINYANGDMVGHTGNLPAAITAMETVDRCVGQLIAAAQQSRTILLVTADHGNCDEMYDAKESEYPNWQSDWQKLQIRPKTSHTLNPVPLYIFDPNATVAYHWTDVKIKTLANIANTVLTLLGVPPKKEFFPSLVSDT